MKQATLNCDMDGQIDKQTDKHIQINIVRDLIFTSVAM